MNVSGVSGGGSSATSYLSSPAVQFAQIQGSTLSTLFGGASGEPTDLTSLTSAVVAMPLYEQPGLLTGLTRWDGSMNPGSQRTPATFADAPAAPVQPTYSFNPFDQSSWGAPPTGSTVDATA